MAKDTRHLPATDVSASLASRDTSTVDIRPNGPVTRDQEWTVQQTRQDLLEQEAQKLKTMQGAYQLGQIHGTVSRVHTEVSHDIASRQDGDHHPAARPHIEHFGDIEQAMAKRHFAETLEAGFEGIKRVVGRSVTPTPEPPKKHWWE